MTSAAGTNAIEGVRRASRVAAESLRAAVDACKAGAATADLERAALGVLDRAGAKALFLGYQQGSSPPYPAALCVSINEEVVHGVPGSRRIAPGDVVSIDVGVRVGEWCSDVATTVLVPPTIPELEALVMDTRGALLEAARLMRPGVAWSVIAATIERRAVERGYAVVTDYVGHAIGRELHERPEVPAHATGWNGEDFALVEGMVLAVEPIFVLPTVKAEAPIAQSSNRRHGVHEPARYAGFRCAMIRRLPDGWTVVTRDGSIACHEEHVVAVRPEGGEILTLL